jgi:hypothetical protein
MGVSPAGGGGAGGGSGAPSLGQQLTSQQWQLGDGAAAAHEKQPPPQQQPQRRQRINISHEKALRSQGARSAHAGVGCATRAWGACAAWTTSDASCAHVHVMHAG